MVPKRQIIRSFGKSFLTTVEKIDCVMPREMWRSKMLLLPSSQEGTVFWIRVEMVVIPGTGWISEVYGRCQ